MRLWLEKVDGTPGTEWKTDDLLATAEELGAFHARSVGVAGADHEWFCRPLLEQAALQERIAVVDRAVRAWGASDAVRPILSARTDLASYIAHLARDLKKAFDQLRLSYDLWKAGNGALGHLPPPGTPVSGLVVVPEPLYFVNHAAFRAGLPEVPFDVSPMYGERCWKPAARAGRCRATRCRTPPSTPCGSGTEIGSWRRRPRRAVQVRHWSVERCEVSMSGGAPMSSECPGQTLDRRILTAPGAEHQRDPGHCRGHPTVQRLIVARRSLGKTPAEL